MWRSTTRATAQLLLWCWSCACKHSKQYSRHTSRDVQAFWNVSFISHSLTGSPNLFVSLSFANSPSPSLSLSLSLSLSFFYKGRYTNNPHMFSSFLTYSCLLEDEHTSLCLFLSISFTHIHDQAHAIIVSLSVPDIGTLRYIHIPNASPPFSIHLFHTFSLSVLLLNFAQVILDTQNDSFSLKQTQAGTHT